jgi:hypothetical protein
LHRQSEVLMSKASNAAAQTPPIIRHPGALHNQAESPIAHDLAAYGVPSTIRSDNGSHFTQQEREQLAQNQALRSLPAPRMTSAGAMPNAVTVVLVNDATGLGPSTSHLFTWLTSLNRWI